MTLPIEISGFEAMAPGALLHVLASTAPALVALAAKGPIHLLPTGLWWPLARTEGAAWSREGHCFEQGEITELANWLKLVLQAKKKIKDVKSAGDRGIITTKLPNCFHFN